MILTRTPLRVSFFGGGSDFRAHFKQHGGAVLSAAIDKYVYVMVNRKYDGKVRISYSQTENVDCVCEIKHDIIRTALQMFGIEKGIEVVTVADVSGHGTGLGSSSALAVGLVDALDWYAKPNMPRLTAQGKAVYACDAEIGYLKKPIGEQDQYATAFGGMHLFEWDGSYAAKTTCLPAIVSDSLNDWLLLLDTGEARGGDCILAKQSANIPMNTATLKAMAEMVHDGYEHARRQNWRKFGELLHQAWEAKKTLTGGISTAAIDEGYMHALSAGAIGGKLCGAGGGGFMLFVVPPDKRGRAIEATGWRELPINIGAEGSTVLAHD